jgi:nicotinamidase-related amidase
MAFIRKGNKPVLLVVDAQIGVLRNTWDAQRVINNIRLAIEKARVRNVPVIWVQHSDQELIRGSADWDLVPELAPADGEVRIDKHFNSSFEQTQLDNELEKLGITHILLAGAATNWCIRATSYAALDRGYDLTLIKDAHTTESIEFRDGTVIKAEDIIRELNVAMQWLSYPDRRNQVISTEDLESVF